MQFYVKNAILSKTYCDETVDVIPAGSSAVAILHGTDCISIRLRVIGTASCKPGKEISFGAVSLTAGIRHCRIRLALFSSQFETIPPV